MLSLLDLQKCISGVQSPILYNTGSPSWSLLGPSLVICSLVVASFVYIVIHRIRRLAQAKEERMTVLNQGQLETEQYHQLRLYQQVGYGTRFLSFILFSLI